MFAPPLAQAHGPESLRSLGLRPVIYSAPHSWPCGTGIVRQDTQRGTRGGAIQPLRPRGHLVGYGSGRHWAIYRAESVSGFRAWGSGSGATDAVRRAETGKARVWPKFRRLSVRLLVRLQLVSFAGQSKLLASLAAGMVSGGRKFSNPTKTMVPPYIPPKDADYDAWLTNFSALITASPTTYGLTAPIAVIIAAQQTAWNGAFVTATTPATRTSVTIAAKDAARVASEAVIRPYAQQVARDPGVTNGDKTALGLNLPNNVPVPVPTPTIAPTINITAIQPLQITLDIRNPFTPTSKAKPPGTIGIQVWTNVGTVAATDPSQCTLAETFTKNPNTLDFSAPDRGKIVTVFARFATRGGQGGKSLLGPWSLPVSTHVA